MYIFISTSEPNEISLIIFAPDGSVLKKIKKTVKLKQSELLLSLVDYLLKTLSCKNQQQRTKKRQTVSYLSRQQNYHNLKTDNFINLTKAIKATTEKHFLQKIKGIIVVLGPGPFSALRVSIVTANILAWCLNIPVTGISANKLPLTTRKIKKILTNLKKKNHFTRPLSPSYGREPNITWPTQTKKS